MNNLLDTTTMDYEKKYKEALERAIECIFHGRCLSFEADLALTYAMKIIFPELAEKSKGGRIAYFGKQKEQKPIEDKDAIEPTPKQDYSGLTEFERAIHRGFLCAGVKNVPVEIIKETAQDCLAHIEQRPAEWSDSFEENIRNLLHDKLTWHNADESLSSAVFIDDKTLKDIISGIWFYVGKEALKYPKKELNVTEWSEEDEENMTDNKKFFLWIYNRLLYVYKEDPDIDYMRSFRKRIDQLFSKPHWKPSDEQLKTLKRAADDADDPEDASVLLNLCRALKKL